jgi:DNA-binding CsgD family transcriptional regulator/tetratricopeptide (TPR) repeat protein
LAELAHHFVEALPGGAADKAVNYATRAGEQASARLAYEEAAQWYERAVQALDEDEGERECTLLLALGEAQHRAGHFALAQESFRRGAALATQQGRAYDLARAAIGCVWATGRGGPPNQPIAELVDSALDALSVDDPVMPGRAAALRARLLAAKATSSWSGSPDWALADEAVADARRSGDPATMAAVFSLVAPLRRPVGSVTPAVITDELFALARTTGSPESELLAWTGRVLDSLERGEIEAADAAIAAHAVRAAVLRQAYHLAFARAHQATRLLLAGEFEAVERSLRELAAQPNATERASGALSLLIFQSQLHSAQGRTAELLAEIEDRTARYPQTRQFAILLGWAYADLGRVGPASNAFDQVLADGADALARIFISPFPFALLAETGAAIGATDRAPELARVLAPFAGRNAVAVIGPGLGPVSRYLGLLSAMLGDWETAAAHFEDALAMAQRMQAPPLIAQAQTDYARMLLTRARTEDAPTAVELLRAARTTAVELGMAGLLARIDTITDGLPATAARSAHPDGLTEREVEVLTLIGAGRTNQEIADALVLSVRTVERHAVNIYAKIGGHTRADAVAYALRHGILPA